jgi:DNA-binding response OmpR family regulator
MPEGGNVEKTSMSAMILVVDDDPVQRRLLTEMIKRSGYIAEAYDNGADALKRVQDRTLPPVDAMVLDLVMPGMSGIEVLNDIRGGRETADLPVIMLTGRSDSAAAVEALAAGADDHVAKPVDFDVLAARIDRVIDRARRIADLKRSNAILDARIAARAMELGEARLELAETRADRLRLIASLQLLNDRFERLSGSIDAE